MQPGNTGPRSTSCRMPRDALLGGALASRPRREREAFPNSVGSWIRRVVRDGLGFSQQWAEQNRERDADFVLITMWPLLGVSHCCGPFLFLVEPWGIEPLTSRVR
jgi:hypothetical protein